jgi:transposase
MEQYTEAFVGIDTAKNKHALAIADLGREGEVRYLGEIDSAPAAVERMIRKLAGRYGKLYFCYEAGPTGYGLYRQVRALGHDCIVVAPSLVPKRPGERVKTNRRDAVTLARLLRAGDLTPVWVPDTVHEAVRDLVRAHAAASQDLRRKHQQLLSFLLRHGRIYSGRKHWTKPHLRWLAQQKFDHPAQQIVFQDAVDTIEDAATRLRRLDEQLAAIVPSWGSAGRSDTGWQQTCPAGADRGCLELSPSGPRQPNPAGAARGFAQSGSRDRLESANPSVCPLPSAHRRRQEASRGHCRNCPRDGGVFVGDRAARRAHRVIASPAMIRTNRKRPSSDYPACSRAPPR